MKLVGIESATDYMVRTMSEQKGRDGSLTLLRPDGTQYPGSPFTGDGLPGPWAVVVDGNDNVWISNFAMPNSPITQLCGVRTENPSAVCAAGCQPASPPPVVNRPAPSPPVVNKPPPPPAVVEASTAATSPGQQRRPPTRPLKRRRSVCLAGTKSDR